MKPSHSEVTSSEQAADVAQAELFVEALRAEAMHLSRTIAQAERNWKQRCKLKGYVDPPDRLSVIQGRLDDVHRMLLTLSARFPAI